MMADNTYVEATLPRHITKDGMKFLTFSTFASVWRNEQHVEHTERTCLKYMREKKCDDDDELPSSQSIERLAPFFVFGSLSCHKHPNSSNNVTLLIEINKRILLESI